MDTREMVQRDTRGRSSGRVRGGTRQQELEELGRVRGKLPQQVPVPQELPGTSLKSELRIRLEALVEEKTEDNWQFQFRVWEALHCLGDAEEKALNVLAASRRGT